MTNFVITLKWVLLVITLIRVNADDTHGIEKRDTNGEAKKVVCYYTNWSVYRPGTAKFTPQNVNPYLCTHLIYAFGGLDKENDGLRPFDKYQDVEQGGYAKFTGLKTYNKNLKTMLAIGGWNEGSSRFSKLVADEDRRATFVKNVVKFLRQNNFDGLDLDWEYPAYRDGSKPADKENYAALVKELKEEFERESSKTGRPRLLLTMAAPAGIEYIDKGYDVPKLNKYLDFMNILTYDYYSVYESKVNHHSPLYSLREESEYNFESQLTIDHTITHYLKKGASPEKLVLGIPTYGRSYTLLNADSTDLESPAEGPGAKGEATKEKGYLAYYEICANLAKGDWTIVQPKKSAMGPYAYRDNQWVGYDDIDSVKLKAKYVNDKGLGGIMFWAIDIDDFRGKCHGKQYPLIEAGKEALFADSGKSSNAIAKSTDKKRTKLGSRKDRPKDSGGKQRTTATVESSTDLELAEDTIQKQDTDVDSKKIVCYHTNWSSRRSGAGKFTIDKLNPNLCTHLIYAFAAPDIENNTIVPTDEDIDEDGYVKFTALKNKNKKLKTMLAIGGWNEGSARFSKLVASRSKRTAFAKNVAKFLRQNDFDGLDIDWQYPTFRDGDPDDKDNSVLFVKELKDEFIKESSKSGKSRLLLTMAVPAGIHYIDKGYDIARLIKYLDFINVLTYDYHSSSDPNVNHHSPLYALPDQNAAEEKLTIDYTINYLIKNGADPKKLILGIPTYGRSYTLSDTDNTGLGSSAKGRGLQGKYTKEDGYLANYEICANLAKDEWTIVHPNKSAMGPYAYHENQWIGYEDTESVKLKAKYANHKGLGGIMFWALDIDDFKGECHNKPYPLIEAGKEALLDNSGNSPETESMVPAESMRTKKITTTSTSSYSLSTPEPPTTPDPGADFVCKEDGFYPHPRDCKKYFWCLDSGPSNLGIVAHQFTCPAGLMFNKNTDSCDYSRNVACNKKSSEKPTTTTTTPKIRTTTSGSKQSSTTTSTTTTTTELPEEEEEEEEEDIAETEEDPKAIKQLITLIKKLGGINELEKQLKLDDGSKEATTPAISKNLYNKVFSNPGPNRFRNQLRNAPPGPQNEGLSNNDDVPYRKDKPQYVTIQRSRPVKNNVAQDTEDSGTTNNKAVQPSKDPLDYDDSDEEETTTVKYSSPRSRTTQKYVVLERHRPEKTTTEEEELLEAELPSSTTQRYITLVRNRSTTTAREIEDTTTEISTQRVIRPVYRTTIELSSEKPKEKVSEIETTTAQNLSVTSAQYVTTRAHSRESTDFPSQATIPDSSRTYVVFAQKVAEENKTKIEDVRVNSTTASPSPYTNSENVTELFTTSIATTVISTIRESATEKTRIPLKMYREFIKKNKTDHRQDLATNFVSESIITKDVQAATLKPRSTTESAFRHGYFRVRKLGNTTTENVNHTDASTEQTASTHSRFFSRKKSHKNATTETDTESSIEEEIVPTTHRYSRHRTTLPDSNAEIDNFFKRRRATSTTEKPVESTHSAFYRGHSRYFTKSKKHKDDVPTTDNISTYKSRYSKNNFQRKTTKSSEILNSRDNNRYAARETTTPSDQLSQSNSNEEEIDLDPTEKPEEHSYRRSTFTTPKTTTDDLSTHKFVFADHFRHKTHTLNPAVTTEKQDHVTAPSTTHRSLIFDHSRAKAHFNITPEHNSTRFTQKSPIADHFRHWARTTTANNTDITAPELTSTHKPSLADHFGHRAHKPSDAQNHTTLPPTSQTTITEAFIIRAAPLPEYEAAEEKESRQSQEEFTSRYSSSTPRTENTPASNPRNNSRFLKNPDPSYRFYEQNRNPIRSYTRLTRPSSKSNSPVFMIQKANESQVGFEVQIRHENEPRSRTKVTDQIGTKFGAQSGRSPLSAEHRERGRKKFTDSLLEEAGTGNTAFVAEDEPNRYEKTSLLDSRRSRTHYSSPASAINSREITTTHRPNAQVRNRGSIKAQSSLSKAEIKELVDLVETPPTRNAAKHHRPINKIEETYYDATPKFTPRHRIGETYLTNIDNFGYSKIYTIPNDVNERYDQDTTNTYYFVNNGLPSESSELDLTLRDVFRVSESQYVNEGARHVYSVGEKSRPTPDKNQLKSRPENINSSESSSRGRGNFRRNNPSQRSHSSTSTTTSTEYTPTESNKFSSRFRRRKGRPENRSINTSRDENIIPLSEIETSTVTRHKNYDISHRGSAIVSDYLPVPEPLYRLNQTNTDQLNGANLNLEDIDAQTIHPPTSNYNSDDVSDLANPVVAAITNLKTQPPASPTTTFSKTVTPQVFYASEPKIEYHTVLSTVRTTAVPIYRPKISYRRGGSRVTGSTTTTTQAPSLQDIYNDYQEDIEYHAEPVEIPITGKVRIHGDGYIECLDMGNFPHPFSCRKFISCAKMEYDTLLGWEYTCPKGLSFDPIGGICNWAAGLGCKD